MVPPEDNGGFAAHKLIDAVEAAIELAFEFGLAREGRLFEELALSAPSAALRHVFFAERELRRFRVFRQPSRWTSRKPASSARARWAPASRSPSRKPAFRCTSSSRTTAVEKAKQMVLGMFMYQVQKGRMTQEEAWKLGQSMQFTDDYNELADADVVVEAVFENMDVKKEVFAKLDGIVKPEGILATNTSTLDIDEMAAVTKRPDKVIGLHFFVPANIMPLLEIVRGKDTSPETIATAFKLAKALRKTAVLAGNAFGFIGNRMIFDYSAAAGALAEEGVSPARIDAVAKKFGFPMGPFAMSDLSGVDVGWRILQERPDMAKSRSNVINRLVEMNRLGQKTGAGYFKYDKNVGKGREPIPDPASKRSLPRKPRRPASSRAKWATARFSSAWCMRWSIAVRTCSKMASRFAQATSTSSTCMDTASRRIAAARCGTPMRSASRTSTTRSCVWLGTGAAIEEAGRIERQVRRSRYYSRAPRAKEN